MVNKSQQKILDDHRKSGKRFIPPLLDKLNLAESKWVNYGIPELLWLALIYSRLGLHGANVALALGKAANEAFNDSCISTEKPCFAFISAYANLETYQKEKIIALLLEKGMLEPIRDSIHSLLIFYPKCPLSFLIGTDNQIENSDESRSLQELKGVVGAIFDKHSVLATQAQAFAIYISFVTDMLKVDAGNSLAKFPQIADYPKTDESRKIAASIRDTIIVLSNMQNREKAQEWLNYFWNRGLEISPCVFRRR